MQKINVRSIQHIQKNYFGNLSIEDKKEFTRKLLSKEGEWSKFLLQNLNAQSPEVIGTSLILIFELMKSLHGKSIARIANLLKHRDEWVRERASEALSRFATKSVLPMIADALTDQNAFVRGYLCEALGRIKGKESGILILKHLQDRDGMVRASAIESAEKLKLKEAIPLLERGLNDRDSLVRGYATSALCFLSGKNCEQLLLRRLKKERDWYAKIKILESLYHLSGSEVFLEKIMKMLSSPQDYIREGVINALENIANKKNVEKIIAALKQTVKAELNTVIKKQASSTIASLKNICSR